MVDAWVEQLQQTVAGLDSAIVHRYGAYSVESMFATANERHLAVWPVGEGPEVVTPQTIGQFPSDLSEQTYIISVWEDASEESTRKQDDDEANKDWLTLYEAIRARLYDQSNQALGATGADTRYVGGEFGLEGGVRLLAIRFTVRRYHTFTA